MKRIRHLRSAVAAGAALVLGAPPAGADEIAEIKAQIEALQERLAKIEAAQKKSEETAVTAGATGGSWKMPGSGTSVSFSGYVKGDFYFDNRNDRGETFNVAGIALEDEEDAADEDGAYGIHARQSRIRFDTQTPTEMGALNTRIETDFYGGGSTLRLRHAYGSLGPVLAGQAWSLLVDEDTAADTVDFDGPMGTFAHRSSQLRLSLDLGGSAVGQVAVEPSFAGNEQPTVLAALRYRPGWGAVNLAGAFGRVDDAGQDVSAYAVHGGAHFNVTDATRLMATFNLTEGVGLLTGGGAGAALDADDKLQAQQTMGGFAGVTHRWSDTIRTGAYVGWVKNETAKGVAAEDAAGTNKALQSLHANVIWSPAPQANIGLEVMHGLREINPKVDDMGNVDRSQDTEGSATRVQVGVQYSF